MGNVDTAELLADQQSWLSAQMELDRYMTAALPAALIVPPRTGDGLIRTLSDQQINDISALYGRLVGTWAHYLEAMRRAEAEAAHTQSPTLPA